jgi:RNA polymerase sigma factor (sigma-70 family)
MRGGPGKNTNPIGSSEGFSRLYERENRTVARFFARRVLDGQTALDLTAETFAQAFLSRKRFRGRNETEQGAWLMVIAQRQLSRYWRKGKSERKALQRLGLEPPEADADDLEALERLTGQAILRRNLAAALAELNADQREALELRIIEDVPYAEIASRLGITEPTARARVSRALRALSRTIDLDALYEEVST